MRDIKFRYWNLQSKTMHSWEELLDMPIMSAFQQPLWLFMQYTGIKDQNGKEIYEGDIVHYRSPFHNGSNNGEVVFNDGGFVLNYCGSFMSLSRKGLITTDGVDNRTVVVGNIYEHLLPPSTP